MLWEPLIFPQIIHKNTLASGTTDEWRGSAALQSALLSSVEFPPRPGFCCDGRRKSTAQARRPGPADRPWALRVCNLPSPFMTQVILIDLWSISIHTLKIYANLRSFRWFFAVYVCNWSLNFLLGACYWTKAEEFGENGVILNADCCSQGWHVLPRLCWCCQQGSGQDGRFVEISYLSISFWCNIRSRF